MCVSVSSVAVGYVKMKQKRIENVCESLPSDLNSLTVASQTNWVYVFKTYKIGKNCCTVAHNRLFREIFRLIDCSSSNRNTFGLVHPNISKTANITNYEVSALKNTSQSKSFSRFWQSKNEDQTLMLKSKVCAFIKLN